MKDLIISENGATVEMRTSQGGHRHYGQKDLVDDTAIANYTTTSEKCSTLKRLASW